MGEPVERVRIFTHGQSDIGWRWGWACPDCGDGELNFGNATTARESADQHYWTCPPAYEESTHA